MKDRVGEKHGKLTIISFDKRINSKRPYKYFWNCRCECGVIKSFNYSNLGRATNSCGCIFKEKLINRNTTHGKSRSSEYSSWSNMINRCYNKKSTQYKDWGGRGIEVCKEWRDSFSKFLEDMGNKPKGYSIDRIDNSKNYEKTNCKWSSKKEQNNNKRSNIKVLNLETGELYSSIVVAAESMGMDPNALNSWLHCNNIYKTKLIIKNE